MVLREALGEHKKKIILLPVCAGLIAGVVNFFVLKPTYTAATRVLPPQQQQSGAGSLLSSLNGVAAIAGASLPGVKNPVDQWVGMLKTRRIQDSVAKKFNLAAVYDIKYPEDVAEHLESQTHISAGKDGIIKIEVDDHDPVRAQGIANAYVAQIQELANTLSLSEAKNRRQYFEKLMGEAVSRLADAEINLKRMGPDVSDVKLSPEKVVTEISGLQAKIMQVELEVASEQGVLTENSPEMKANRRVLAELKAKLSALTSGTSMTSREGRLGGYVESFRDFKYREAYYEFVFKQYQMASLDEARDGGLFQVIDFAEKPNVKSRPKRLLNVLMTVLVTFAAVLARIFLPRLMTSKP